MKQPCSWGWSSTHVGWFVLSLAVASTVSENAAQHRSNQIQSLPEPVPLNNDFDWKLTKEVFRDEQQNAIFSPFSIKLLLTLLYEASGEKSNTRRELSSALAGSNLEKNRQLYREFLEASTKENEFYEFNIGTRVFVDQMLANVTADYTQLIESCYKTSIQKVVFKDSKVTMAKVNDWCSKITHGHLNDLVDEDQIKQSAMIMANVLFLKASWKNSFDESMSRKLPFYVNAYKSVSTTFMERNSLYQYANDPELQVEMLRIPYKGRDFSMTILLPYVNQTLAQTIETLSTEKLAKLESKLFREEIIVIIPKFKFDYGVALNDALAALGISDIFTGKASLPQLSGGTNSTLQVSKVLQKAGIEVNEKGTLAVAATELELVSKFGADSPLEFSATRPFLFYIKDEESDALLFVGKVLNPAA